MAAKATKIPEHQQALLPLTPAVFFVLFALAGGEKHGYAIMQETNELSDGKFRMGPGTLYTTIQRLLDLDVIEETTLESESGNRRRNYRLTRSGKALFEAEIRRLDVLVSRAHQRRLVPRRSE